MRLVSEAHRRARMRSRRGLLELDLLLVPFCEAVYAQLSETQQACYEALLGEDDVELLVWLKGEATPTPELQTMVERIRKWHREQGALR